MNEPLQSRPAPSRSRPATFGRLKRAALVVLALAVGLDPARADYEIMGGDALEIAVAGMPALRRRMTVNADGAISFPLIGNVAVAGLSVGGVRDRLQALLVERNLAVNPDVTVEIAEYRPVYVMGDVLKPGAYPFRPGLSVRNAIALAGGYDQQQLHGRNPLLESATARGDYQLAAIELIKQQARITRIKAELSGKQVVDVSDIGETPVSSNTVAEVIRIENEQLKLNLEGKAKERDYYDRLRKTTEAQITQVVQDEDYWSKSAQQASTEFDRLQGLLQRSVSTAARVDDAQQRMLTTQSRLFDVRGRLNQLRRDLGETGRKQDAALDESRGALLTQLREAVVDLTKMRYALDVAFDKMRLAGRVPLQRARAPRVVVYSAGETPKQGVEASENAVLTPGETVDIAFDDPTIGGSASWMLESSAGKNPAPVSDAGQHGATPTAAKPGSAPPRR